MLIVFIFLNLKCRIALVIKDQGHCGSCWAFGSVESLSDRFCIHFDRNVSLSANDVLACCGVLCGSGCDGASRSLLGNILFIMVL